MEKTSSTPHTFTWNLNSLRYISQRLMDEGLSSLLEEAQVYKLSLLQA